MSDDPQEQAGLRRCLRVGAAFLLKARSRVVGAKPLLGQPGRPRWNPENDAPGIIERDPDLRERFAGRFPASGVVRPLRIRLVERGEEIVAAVARVGALGTVTALLGELQAEALQRALVELNRPALAKWARAVARAERGGRVRRPSTREIAAFWAGSGARRRHATGTLTRPRRPRGRPAEREWLVRLRRLGLERRDAEDLIALACLRIPPRPKPLQSRAE